tara:strand:+ start:2649 stop:3071 length:423 start_codon:yes stop_codon:yes gene_type:complete
MSEQFKIYAEFIKDLSSETKDLETYVYVKEYLKNYNLNIEISSQPLKNRFIEVNTKLTYQDKNQSKLRSFFEINYTTVIKVNEDIKDKKTIEKIVLCDVQKKIYNNLEKSFINLIKDSGFPNIKIEKKIDFEQLYNQRFN